MELIFEKILDDDLQISQEKLNKKERVKLFVSYLFFSKTKSVRDKLN